MIKMITLTPVTGELEPASQKVEDVFGLLQSSGITDSQILKLHELLIKNNEALGSSIDPKLNNIKFTAFTISKEEALKRGIKC